jgi:glutaredoxin
VNSQGTADPAVSKVKVFTKDNCPACTQLKMELKRDNVEFVEINIGKDISREDFITQYPNIKRVPYVVAEDYRGSND